MHELWNKCGQIGKILLWCNEFDLNLCEVANGFWSKVVIVWKSAVQITGSNLLRIKCLKALYSQCYPVYEKRESKGA